MLRLRDLRPWKLCPECGERAWRCGARKRLGWRYLIRHWWNTGRAL